MRTALVTGATSGIGLATTLALSESGWWVLGSGRDEQQGKDLQAQLEARHGGQFVGGDLTAEETPPGLVATAVEATGRLDLLVNNAGIHFLADVPSTAMEQFDALMALNVRAAFHLAREAVPAMKAGGGGLVVNVGSEAGIVAVPGQAAYNLSKAALGMLTKSLAVDHAADGIRAVTVCPGTTRTPLVDAAIASAPDPAAHERRLAATRPAGRLGTPAEIAAAIVFLAGDSAGFITGTDLVIDGGYTAQ